MVSHVCVCVCVWSAVCRRELRGRLAYSAVVAVGSADRRRTGRLLRSPGSRRRSVHVLGRPQRPPRHAVRRTRSRRRPALAAHVPSPLSRLTRYQQNTHTPGVVLGKNIGGGLAPYHLGGNNG